MEWACAREEVAQVRVYWEKEIRVSLSWEIPICVAADGFSSVALEALQPVALQLTFPASWPVQRF